MIRRIWFVFIVLSLLYLGILYRLFYWQILNGQGLKVRALSQYAQKVTLMPNRGEILSSDGSPLVLNQPSYLAFAEPNHIDDKVFFSRQIAAVLQKPDTDLLNEISVPNRKWVPLARRITADQKDDLEKLSLKGLGFESSTMRFYPEASMAAHLLGFVGQDSNGKDQGYFGLEGYYNRELSGKEGSKSQEHDAHGSPILIGDAETVEPQDGRSLVLWLDRTIQYSAQKRLAEGIQKYGAMSGTVVIMDPKTGGILASVSYPDYDPMTYSSFSDDVYKNPAVSYTYEPGSVFKPLIMAAAINENLVHADTTFNESGRVQIGEYSIQTWDDTYHGTISMTDILRYSSNVGMVFVSKQLGDNKMIQYIKNYGFGQKTDIDLQDEISPELRPINEWTPIDYATSSFGQGIAVTPIQILRAIGALANGGKLMQPMVVKEFKDSSGKITPLKENVVRQVISKQAAKEIKDMMVDAVRYGEAKWAAPKGYKVAGKTGTAQIPVAGHYDPTKTIASFVGFAPADDPKFVMLVVLNQPKSSEWGSETAAPLFFNIARDIFSYMGIPPSNN